MIKQYTKYLFKKDRKLNSYTCLHSGETFHYEEKAFVTLPDKKGRWSKPLIDEMVTPCQVTGHQLAHFHTIESFNEWNYYFQCPISKNKFRYGESALCCHIEHKGRATDLYFEIGIMNRNEDKRLVYFNSRNDLIAWDQT